MKSFAFSLVNCFALCTVIASTGSAVTVLAQSPVPFTPGPQVTFSPGLISTVAGGGTATPSDGAAATSVALSPTFLTLDQAGDLYFADLSTYKIYKISQGSITTVAGNGSAGYSGDNGPATQAQIYPFLSNVAVDAAGNVYIADTQNSVIRKVIAATGVITTVAGNGSAGYSGDNGPATQAQLQRPRGVSVDAAGNLYIADTNNQRIRMVSASTGAITTVVGNATGLGYSGDGGPATQAHIGSPRAIAIDSAGNLYVPDVANCVIRKVNAATQIITLYAGSYQCGFSGDGGAATSAKLYEPESATLDAAGNLYITDIFNAVIRKVNSATGTITTYAGIYNPSVDSSGNPITNLPSSGDGGPANKAYFLQTYGIAIDTAGNLYATDSNSVSQIIRKITAAAFPLTFASIDVGASSPPQTVTVGNTGNQPLQLTNLAISSNFVQQSSGNNDCSSTTTLQIAQECTLQIAFAPLKPGSFNGTVTLTDNANAQSLSPQIVALTGTTPVFNAAVALNTIPGLAYGTPTTLTAAVSYNGAPVTVGTVQFSSPGFQLGSAAVTTAGVSSVTTTFLPAGNYAVTAAYQGSGDYTSSSAQTTVSVQPAPLTITAAPASRPYGAPNPTLSAAITGAVNNDTLTATATTTAVPNSQVGTYPITPTATGSNITDYAVTPVAAVLTVTKAATTATLAASTSNANLGAAVTFTAVVTSSTTGTPTGSVQFFNGSTVLATVSLAGGTGSYTTSSLAAGTYSITAAYSGDVSFSPSTTAVLTQQVTAPDFTIAANPSSLTIAAGQSGSTTFTMTPVGGFSQSINLTCSGLPQFTTCTFSPATLAANGSNTPGTTQLTIATNVQSSAVASSRALHGDRNRSPNDTEDGTITTTLAGILLLYGLGRARRRPGDKVKLLGLCALTAALLTASGCGGSSNNTPAGSSTVTVSAAATGSAARTATLTITITR
jgi:sugar lactone lactonase YvrE